MWRPRRNSLFSYTLMLVIPVATVTLVLVWLLGNKTLVFTVKEDTLQRILEIGKYQAARIDDKLTAAKTFAKTLASDEAIINGLEDVESQAPRLSTLISTFQKASPINTRISLVDGTGYLISSGQVNPEKLIPLADDAPNVIASSEQLRFFEPVYHAGSVKGAVILDCDVLSFIDQTESLESSDELITLSLKDRMFYSSSPSLVALGGLESEINLEGWLKGRHALSVPGMTLFIAWSPEKQLRALGAVHTLERSILFTSLIVTIALIVATLWVVSRRLRKFAAELAATESPTANPGQKHSEDPQEMAELSSAFNRMKNQLNQAAEKEHLLQLELCEAQKLEAIGRLASGVAHEINTPCHYVADNLYFLDDAQKKLIDIVQECQALNKLPCGSSRFEEQKQWVDTLMYRYRVDYLMKEVPAASKQTITGIDEITRIAEAINEMSHPTVQEKTLADLNGVLQNGIIISRGLWKYIAKVETELDPNLPLVSCFPEQVNQVFVNIIINAAHAIEQTSDPKNPGLIKVSTLAQRNKVLIRISDNGCGIAALIRDQVFSPFFTTKTHGKGTGQGLAIARDIIVNKHGGDLYFDAKPDRGTVFTIELPL